MNPGSGHPCVGFPSLSGPRLEISDADRTRLVELARRLEGREERIVDRWTELHGRRFGGGGFFPPGAFREEAEDEVRTVLAHLRAGSWGELARWFAERGRILFERGAPFEEISRSLQMFEESVAAALPSGEPDGDVVAALGRLDRERLVLVVEAYHHRCKWRWERREELVLDSIARRESEDGRRDRLGGLVGRSAAMQRVYEQLTLASSGRDTVLIVGETGTGKELAARTVHGLSGDDPARLVPVNCAAIAADLVESELFGHRRGAFSGAQREHEGLFRAAHEGTLFLDEVTELPSSAQAKLLRALQERAVRPVGAIAEVPVAVRIVASTNLDLAEALGEGRIRRDLYYRLQEHVVRLPPLRERREDLPLLVAHFAEQAAREGLCPRAPAFAPEALARLDDHAWPGNVRELKTVVRRACRAARGGLVREVEIPAAGTSPHVPPARSEAPEPVSLEAAERGAIVRALSSTAGNKASAARLLGISRKQLYVKIRKYGL